MIFKSQNIFDLRFRQNPNIKWHSDDQGIVEFEVVNRGFYNFIAQKLFKRPRVSKIKLDALGSFVWIKLLEKDDIMAISEDVKIKFGKDAEPLLERLGKFFQLLDRYGFVTKKKDI